MGMRTRTRTRGTGGAWGRAVVLGGGYAGLVTARVLTGHFREVTVLERDVVDAETGVHPHTPQGHHAHVMLAKGAAVLEWYFPGLRAELEAAGAPVFDYGEGVSFLQPAGYAPRDRTGVRVQSFTRGELERRLRRRVLALPGVTLLPATRCEGLVMDLPGSVTGVRYRRAGNGQPVVLDAELVVDATGRSSRLDDWLAAHGTRVPGTRTVRAKFTYTTMIFDRAPHDPPDFRVAYQMMFAPHVARGGVIMAVERDRWMCSLVGQGDQAPPVDDAGYLAFARSLDTPHLAEQIARRTRQESMHRYTTTANEWRPYHACKDWPERLVAVGDTVCALNPVYGQGLTLAALEADLLHRTLTRHRVGGRGLEGLSRTYQRKVARIVAGAWAVAGAADLMWDPRGRTPQARFAHWYNRHLFQVAVSDARTWARFARVVNMLAPPALLFHPAVLARVLGRAARGRR